MSNGLFEQDVPKKKKKKKFLPCLQLMIDRFRFGCSSAEMLNLDPVNARDRPGWSRKREKGGGGRKRATAPSSAEHVLISSGRGLKRRNESAPFCSLGYN